MRRSRAAPASQRRSDVGFAIASCAVLVAYNNVAGMLPWHHRRYTLLNVCATGAALAAAATAGGWVLIASVPATRPVLGDDRIRGLSGREVAYQVLVRIPLGTVLWEETAFRGVLQAALGRVMPGPAAIAVTSCIFGIWHVGPTAAALRINGLADRGRILAGVTAGVT